MEIVLNKEEMQTLEQVVRAAITTRKKELSLSDEALGGIAFPFMANPAGKVQALLVGQGAGENRKPQQMKIGDMINLCEGVGLRWADVLQGAVREVKKR